MTSRMIVAGVLLLIGLMPVGGPSAAGLQPLTIGWEQFFRLDWSTGTQQGRPVVYGRVYNAWGVAAANVRLLVDGLNDKGEVESQTIGWLAFPLTPGTTAPFEVSVDGRAPSYRVSVFAYDWVQRGRGPN